MRKLVAGGSWLVAGGSWLVAGAWWLVAGGWWLVARRRGRAVGRALVAVAVAAAALTIATERGEAHKAVTSKYTYNDDVFPIVREKCAQCHVEHGVAPMSLTTYKDAYPWAESIRAELIAGHMPPWTADESFGSLKQKHTLTAHELDVMLTWATGGNPQGDLNAQLPAITLKNDWTLGKPDLAIQLPQEFTVAADQADVTQEFTLPTGTTEARWVRAVDLLPGTPSIVRSAVVYLKDAGAAADASAAPSSDRILALWLPGHDAEPLNGGAAFKLPAGAQLGVRIHYKKTWQFEGQAISDRSTVGVYFDAANGAQELLALPVNSPAPPAMDASNRTFTYTRTIDSDMVALALRPDNLPPNIVVQVEGVLANGTRTPLIRWNTRADWARRYWFEKPIALPRGSRIEVTATYDNPDLLSEAFDTLATTKTAAAPAPLRLALDVLPANAKPTAP